MNPNNKITEMTAEQLSAYLKQTEETLRKLENLKTVASTKLNMLRERLKDINAELQKRGIQPNKLEEELTKIDQQIAEKQAELEKLLPIDVINRYKAISPEELSDARVLETVNLAQEF